MRRAGPRVFAAGLAAVLWTGGAQATETVTVGSKAFPESWVLGEAVAVLAREAGADARHRQNLGATEITYAALSSGAIDVYPEYTGTIREVLLKGAHADSLGAMREALARSGVGMSEPLGFDDAYGLATRAAAPATAGLRTLSDLARAPELRVGFTHEFMGRADGYPGLAARYGLSLRDVRGVQHELAVEALARGGLDVIDVYTTDAQIDRLGLRVLDDDRGFFPRYEAVLLYRAELPERAPRAFAAAMRLVGHVDEKAIRRANARVAIDGASVHDAAVALCHDALGVDPADVAPAPSVASDIARNAARHMELVGVALLLSLLLGLPLGIAAARSRLLGFLATSFAGVLQTIPSLALLALLVPLSGIGARSALVALVLYGLLPIVRGTQVGLTTIPAAITESAEALGLSSSARLWRVMLPIASPQVLSGARTSAVIGVGTATLAALIGAEGLGGPILQGIALRNTGLVMQGAVPAALLALAVDAGFAGLSRVVVPRGLRAAGGPAQ